MKTYKFGDKTYKVVDLVYGCEMDTYEKLCKKNYVPSQTELKQWCKDNRDEVKKMLNDFAVNDIASSTHYKKDVNGEVVQYIEGISLYNDDFIFTAEHDFTYGIAPLICFEEVKDYGNRVKLNDSDHYEILCSVILDPEKHPIAYQSKLDELVRLSGMTEEEAVKFIRTTPIEMELYYSPDSGLFAVEAEAISGGATIFDPYTGIQCEDYGEID